jgi:ribulose-phosphate 3-epimerase
MQLTHDAFAPGIERALLGFPRLAARIVAPDLACAGREVAAAVRAGAERVHLDVMGGLPADVATSRLACRALRRVTGAPVEAHLMVKPSPELVAALAEGGADTIAFHPEDCEDVRRAVALVKEHGCAVGLALAAGCALDSIEGVLGEVDLVLVTSATPGLDGQKFMPAALRWIRALRARLAAADRRVGISVDGGVAADNAAELVAAGADTLVVDPIPCPPGERTLPS